MRKRGTGKTEYVCKECGKHFIHWSYQSARRKYCSIKCRIKGHAKRMFGKDLGGSITKNCVYCGKEFSYFKSSKLNRECCSDSCRHELHSKKISGKNHPMWVGGTKGYRGCDWRMIRIKVLERDSHKCTDCGTTKRLDIHHKKPYRISKDNSLKNLITLCRSCHIKEERRLCKI